MSASPTQEQIEARIGEVAGRLFGDCNAAIEAFTVHFGHKLGLYAALNDLGGATSKQLAERAKTAERYTREWLEQQAVAGFIDVDDVAAGPEDRRYTLPAGLEAVFLDPDSPANLVPLTGLSGIVGRVESQLLDAFRSGEGVPYSAYGPEAVEAQEALNRPQFRNFLTTQWLPSIPQIHNKLAAGGRLADVACGGGISTIEIAKAYPNATVDGFDADELSISRARRNAADAKAKVRFEVVDGADRTIEGPYDAATIFEAVHDMADPVGVLRNLHRALTDDGVVLVADEKAAETFTAPGDDFERFFYGASLVWCLPQSMAEKPSAAIGTAIRPETMRSLAAEAGFASTEILPIEHDGWRFYLLRK